MVQLRCPDCQLVLSFPGQIPGNVLECPACGALFQWNAATGIITHFYKEEERDRAEETRPEPEGDVGAAAPERSPEEVIANVGRRWGQHINEQENDQPRRFHRAFLLGASLVLGLGAVISLADGHLPSGEMLLGVFVFGIVVGFLLAVLATAFVDVVEALTRFRRRTARNAPGDVDLDELAERAKARVVRRPLPSPGPPRSGREEKTSNGPDITTADNAHPTPAQEGPPDAITKPPPLPSAPHDFGRRAAPGADGQPRGRGD